MTAPSGSPNRLHLCMYTPTGEGGHALYTRELLEALRERAGEPVIEPCLVTCVEAADYDGVPFAVHRVVGRLRHKARFRTPAHWAAARLTEYLRRETTFLRWVLSHPEYSVIHAQEYWPWLGWLHVPRMRRAGRRVFMTVHNVTPHRKSTSRAAAAGRSARHAVAKLQWRSCDGLFVLSERLGSDLAGLLGPGHPPIHVAPHGVWSRPDTPADGGTGPVASGSPWRLLFFGVIRPNKGLHTLLAAMGELDDCVLAVVGQGVDEAYMASAKRAITALPRGRVTLTEGFVPATDLPRHFAAADLLVLPYTASFGAQSGVLHDAISHLTPVVATDVGAVGDTVRALGIGQVVRTEDVADLRDGIRQMLTRERLDAAQRALALARSTHTWSAAAEASVSGYLTAHDNS